MQTITHPTVTENENAAADPVLPKPSKWMRRLAIGAGVALAIIGFQAFDIQARLGGALDAIEGLGLWGAALFIVLYAAATVLFLPASVLTLGAGAVFGVAYGTIYVSIGSMLGAMAAFLIGRYGAREWIAKKIEGNTRFAAIDRAVADEGWKIVGLTRLSPIFPFALLNYAFGLTRVSFRHFTLASWIGMVPGTVMYVYLGSLGSALATAEGRSPGEWALLIIGFAATVAVTIYVTKISRRALAGKIEETPHS